MTWRRIIRRLTSRGQRREIRAWPLLALLVLVLIVGISCVLWFMNEAVENERMAVRQRLAEAYRGHLQLVRGHLEEIFVNRISQLDTAQVGTAGFSQQVMENNIDCVLHISENGTFIYPQLTGKPPTENEETRRNPHLVDAESVQAKARELIRIGDIGEAAQLILGRFAGSDLGSTIDENGRSIAANAELMILEAAPSIGTPHIESLLERLQNRLNDYHSQIPSSQRRLLMRELQRLYPARSLKFPTWQAENLAAQYLESQPVLPSPLTLGRTPMRHVWHVLSPERRVIALLGTERLQEMLAQAMARPEIPEGVHLHLNAPLDDAPVGPLPLLILSAGPHFPGWNLTLTLNDHALFETAASRKVARYLWTATFVVIAMIMLVALIARTFRKQVQLAQLKNNLVATVSHELKTPLTSMRVLVDTLLDAEKLDESITREYLQLLAQENIRLSRLVGNMLTFSRLERNKLHFDFSPTSPEEIISDVISAMGDRWRAPECHFESHIEPNLPFIQADRDALTSAVLNLLDNAWKYSGDHKRIVLRVETHDALVRIHVQDNGIGLARREVRRIFRQFYQVDHRLSRSAGGCGLGLSIVEQIVTAHRGAVRVTSKPERGSTFTIEIPALKNLMQA